MWLQAPVDEVVVRPLRYNACMDVIDSDHKPVWALLALDVPVTNQQKKRRMCSHFLKQAFEQETAAAGKPALQMSCETVRLSQVSASCYSAGTPALQMSCETVSLSQMSSFCCSVGTPALQMSCETVRLSQMRSSCCYAGTPALQMSCETVRLSQVSSPCYS